MKQVYISLLLAASLLASCADDKKQPANTKGVGDQSAIWITADSLQHINLNQDISTRSLAELRILKGMIYAKAGHCFMEADLRGYFDAHMEGYDSIMSARWELLYEKGGDGTNYATVKLTPAEQAFVQRIAAQEALLLRNNYVERNGEKLANVANIINVFQFQQLPDSLMQRLAANNFAIVPRKNQQLFHVYEQNDYQQLPNFVTTDMYLQLYHMYFSYLLRVLEQQQLVPAIAQLSNCMYNTAMQTAQATTDARLRDHAAYVAATSAIPYFLLTGVKKDLPAPYADKVAAEIAAIAGGEDGPSALHGGDVYFNYSLFKPRGHYTKSDTAGRYFRAMMWLQHSFMCQKDPAGMERATMMAAILNSGKDATGKPLMALYERVYQPIAFLIGSPDNLSVYDIASELKTANIASVAQAMEPAAIGRMTAAINALAPTRNRIKPKIAVSCEDKINMMPQRYVFDNEIMQALVDVRPDAQRAYPRGLDVMAVLGSKTAEQILMNEYKDGAAWPAYARELARLGLQFQQYTGWDDDVYSKWMQCLKALQLKDNRYPPLMQTDRWARKNLNTALASWAELKHDAILYAEQPMGAECGGGGPPKPITVGYVEPNTSFWKCMTELLTLTETMLKTYGMESDETTDITKRMKDAATFLLSASEKSRGAKNSPVRSMRP